MPYHERFVDARHASTWKRFATAFTTNDPDGSGRDVTPPGDAVIDDTLKDTRAMSAIGEKVVLSKLWSETVRTTVAGTGIVSGKSTD